MTLRALLLITAASLTLAAACSESDPETTPPPDAGGGDASSGAGAAGAAGAGAGTGGQAGTGGAAGAAGGGVDCGAELPSPTLLDPTTATELSVAGDPAAELGIFDPSLAYPTNETSGAMAYSAVPSQRDVHTRIAVSSDAGATWTYAATINSARDVTAPAASGSTRCPSGVCSGRLIHEVPSLLFDPSDSDAARRYKLFVHSYLVLQNEELARDLGYIGLFTAPAPEGPWADAGKLIGWQGESQLSSADADTVATTFGQLADCVALTEPSAILTPGGIIDLAVGCAALADGHVEIRVELLRSFDNAKTFSYAGRLLAANEALCLGSSRPEFNAAQLFVAQGTTYLLASPAGPTSGGFDGYRGCYVFQVQLATAGVQRDSLGNPLVRRILAAPGDRFSGACSYAEGASAHGYLMSALRLESPPRVFRVYESGVSAP